MTGLNFWFIVINHRGVYVFRVPLWEAEKEMGFFDNIKAKLNAFKSHSYDENT